MSKEKNKGSAGMRKSIKAYLDKFAKENPLFAEKYQDKTRKKSIADCCTYIVNQVQKSKAQGFEDDEVFGWARHYYDEDKIDDAKADLEEIIKESGIPKDNIIIAQPKPIMKPPVVAEKIKRCSKCELPTDMDHSDCIYNDCPEKKAQPISSGDAAIKIMRTPKPTDLHPSEVPEWAEAVQDEHDQASNKPKTTLF